MPKRIRVFYSTLSDKFFASASWKEKDGIVRITGEKYDATQDIASAIVHHDIEFTPVEGETAEEGER